MGSGALVAVDRVEAEAMHRPVPARHRDRQSPVEHPEADRTDQDRREEADPADPVEGRKDPAAAAEEEEGRQDLVDPVDPVRPVEPVAEAAAGADRPSVVVADLADRDRLDHQPGEEGDHTRRIHRHLDRAEERSHTHQPEPRQGWRHAAGAEARPHHHHWAHHRSSRSRGQASSGTET